MLEGSSYYSLVEFIVRNEVMKGASPVISDMKSLRAVVFACLPCTVNTDPCSQPPSPAATPTPHRRHSAQNKVLRGI